MICLIYEVIDYHSIEIFYHLEKWLHFLNNSIFHFFHKALDLVQRDVVFT